MRKIQALLASLFSLILPLAAQRPSISPDGVVNAASYVPPNGPNSQPAPGSVVAIFGTHLAIETQTAGSVPLPFTLARTSVTIGGLPAPLFYVSPGQIDAQVPFRVLGQYDGERNDVPVVVTTAAGPSQPSLITVRSQAPGIFIKSGGGCGEPALQMIMADGTLQENSPENSAQPGQYITVYGTGLGWPNRDPREVPADGAPAPLGTLLPAMYSPGGFWGLVPSRLTSDFSHPWFYGKAPGQAGVDQFNMRIPDDVPEGCTVPLRIFGGNFDVNANVASQPVPVSIRRGGGQCVDRPDGLGYVTWVKTVSSGIANPPPAERVEVQFTSSIGNRFREPVDVFRKGLGTGCYCEVTNLSAARVGPMCPGFDAYFDRALPARNLSGQIGDTTVSLEATRRDGLDGYAAVLPEGSLRGGVRVRLQASGGEVGPLDTATTLPEPIRLTTTFAPGTTIRANQLTLIQWSGGDPESNVRVLFTARNPSVRGTCECLAQAKAGQIGYIDIESYVLRQFLLGSDDAEITVSQSAEGSEFQLFRAPGLSLGGRHGWRYEWKFGGLRFR